MGTAFFAYNAWSCVLGNFRRNEKIKPKICWNLVYIWWINRTKFFEKKFGTEIFNVFLLKHAFYRGKMSYSPQFIWGLHIETINYASGKIQNFGIAHLHDVQALIIFSTWNFEKILMSKFRKFANFATFRRKLRQNHTQTSGSASSKSPKLPFGGV